MSAAVEPSIGDIIGGYSLESILGKGGMGCVYRAHHARLGRKAAVKLLSSNLAADEEYVSRFFHEARIVNEIGHPNIIDIIDFVEDKEPRRVAYIMELIDGPPLSAVLKNQPLNVRQAVNAAFQLANALEAVHGLQVVHRDLKPDNILVIAPLESDLSTVPSVKVLDFGIAKMQSADAGHKTGTGMILGTPAYMAPEQVAAEPVSPATDVYALGEIFYEMLSGLRVFNGDNMSVLKAKLIGEPPQLPLPEGLPCEDRIRQLVTWCLALSPADRPTLAELRSSLLEILAEAGEAPVTYTHQPHTYPHVLKARARPPVEVTPVNYAPSVAMLSPEANKKLILKGAMATLGAVAIACAAYALNRPKADATPAQTAAVLASDAKPRAAAAAETRAAQKIRVETEPTQSEIIDAKTDLSLCTAPCDIEIAKGDDARRIRVRLNGYIESTVAVGRDNPSVHILLTKVEESEAAQKPAPKADEAPRPVDRPKAAPRRLTARAAAPAPTHAEKREEPAKSDQASGPLRRDEVTQW